MKTSLAAVILLSLLASCAGTSPYTQDYPLTEQSFVSRSGLLHGRVPQGWFTSSEDTLAPALELWLLREDLAASVTLREFRLDPFAESTVDRGGLILLAEISLALRPSPGTDTVITTPACFTAAGHDWCGYELVEDGIPRRVVVFTRGGRYYECVAAPLRTSIGANELRTLFTVQQTVLATIASR